MEAGGEKRRDTGAEGRLFDGGVVDGAGDLRDDALADGEGRGGIGDEDGDGQAAAIGQSDEADVVGGVEGGAVLAGGSGFAGDDRSGRQQSAEALIAGVRGGHPAQQQLGVRGRERGALGETEQQPDQRVSFADVAVEELQVAILIAFVIADLDAVDHDAGEILLGGGGSADGAEEDVGGDVVAVDDGAAQEFLDGHVDGAVGMLVAERAVAGGSDQIRRDEVERLREGELSGFDGVQNGDGDGQLVHRHHGELRGGIEAAVEGFTGHGAGDADATMNLSRDADDFIVKLGRRGDPGLGGQREREGGKQEKREAATGGHSKEL